MAEELRPQPPIGVRSAGDRTWHIAAAERWSDGELIGHRTLCGRNYPGTAERNDPAGLTDICSDCTAQVAHRH
ncbi:MAG TPA: hypothetical protein VLA76_05410 [Candidatus Angelobacter sp.]|nr:hypothetical protein [Candidatus Angelobacter sp.]